MTTHTVLKILNYKIILAIFFITLSVLSCSSDTNDNEKSNSTNNSVTLNNLHKNKSKLEIIEFKVEPPFVMVGQEVTLTWKTSGSSSVKITGFDTVFPAEGSIVIKSKLKNKYTLIAKSKMNIVRSSVQLNFATPLPVAQSDPKRYTLKIQKYNREQVKKLKDRANIKIGEATEFAPAE